MIPSQPLLRPVRPTFTVRVKVGIRYLLITAALLICIGLASRAIAWPLVTTTLGPTAYVFAAHPDSEAARLRNAFFGHLSAFAAGLFALAVFGLWDAGPISSSGAPSLTRVGAAAVAVGVTLLALELVGSHHAPAAATTLLIATGLARPGKPLLGLAVGLGILLILGPLSASVPFARAESPTDTPPAGAGTPRGPG
ncbi:MAG: HPP family protein [Acidimicrobiales bacterium]